MVSLLRVIVLLITFMLVTACASNARVQSDFENGLDFSQYDTYNFRKPAVIENPAFTQFLGQSFRSAIEPQMLVRGIAKSDNPDVLINVTVDVEDISRAPAHNSCPSYGDYYSRYLGKNLGSGGGDTPFCRYTEGTIKIDMVDVEQERTIWKGVSRVRIDKREQGQNFTLQRYIIADVGVMFEDFPFQARQQIAWMSENNQIKTKP